MQKQPLDITIETGIPESTQSSNFQNATLFSATDSIAASIAVFPPIPEGVKSEQDVKQYLEKVLAPLCEEGWHIEIQIGPNIDHEKEE